ncbi:EF-P lysine aminoacylase EpmA [Candidatus Albibeggiatoa sp. nov. NOAA]|uniref:EF-P lysine aminoacylase EpmA n=1 Tax=Candidatus Albibeggiatoa sp. nov. NOAA TaxID=3162724 RepID=UPI0032F9A741|nr:EF-P lysine aminoacylase EpmA [Thiotrichaceae bacterium]
MSEYHINWQPDADLAYLQRRAQLYQRIRQFFAERDVLEVETPVLSHAAVPEPSIEPLSTQLYGEHNLYLQTSPELPMKRLLAAGSGAIFQICKVFRDDEFGRWHNPEFSLLEWYRPDFNQDDLIQEVSAFLQFILDCPPAKIITYEQIFDIYLSIHPLETELSELQQFIKKFGLDDVKAFDRDTCLQLLMSYEIEPRLPHDYPIAIKDFPASQAALARKNPDNPQWAARFEVYFKGAELANGFHELTDPIEQRQRFGQDLIKRAENGQTMLPIDEHFLAALDAGLPDCAGVALGVDRLLMLWLGVDNIQEVLSFSIKRC